MIYQESDGTGYLVLRASKVNVEALDMELFMYHYFKVSCIACLLQNSIITFRLGYWFLSI